MDIYLISLLIGGLGLAAMGLMGLGSHGHDSGGGHGHDAGGGHGHAGHSGHGDLTIHHGHTGGNGGHDAGHVHHGEQHHDAQAASPLLQLMSPRVIFSVAFGLGATGLALRPLLIGGPLLAFAAIAGGIALERLIVQPLWNWFMRFGSNPAMTLESAIESEAVVVSSFDSSGHGLVSVEVDGQVVQLLATLRRAELGKGDRVKAGDTVRIEEIDAARNRCTVTRL